jgi:hypothetical protein
MSSAENPSTTNYTVGKGIIYFDRFTAAGASTGYRDLGNAPALSLSTTIEKLKHYSSRSGIKSLDFTANTSKEAMVKFTLDEIKVSQQTSTNVNELKKEVWANLGLTQPDRFINDPQQQQQTGLPPEAEWVLIKRMADGSIPTNPILIQPGEDYRKHYEEHIAQTATEEYDALPPQYQYIWNVHIMSYDKVMKVLDAKKYEADKEIEVQNKEVAVPQ